MDVNEALDALLDVSVDSYTVIRAAYVLASEVTRLRKESFLLRNLAANAILMARHGDYANGVTDPTGCIDEGLVKAGEAMNNLESEAAALRVVVKGTFYDNDQYYQAAKGGAT